MNISTRRRLAAGVIATSSALVAGVLIIPAFAAQGGLKITPNGAFNTQEAAEITFESTDADFSYGAEATFTRVGGGVPFVVEIDGNLLPTSKDTQQSQDVDFTDMGKGLGNDGPADAGTYSVSLNGNEADIPAGAPGGGNDTCTSCFTVLSPGPVAVTSVAPTSLRPGQAGNVSVLGNNFERGTRIDIVFPTGGVDTSVSTNNPPLEPDGDPIVDEITTRTELKRRFAVATTATPGVRDVRVTNLDGTTAVCPGCFFVAGAELQSVNPTAGVNDPQAPPISITFNGPEIAENGVPRLEFVGNPGAVPRSELTIVGENPQQTGTTSITATFDLRNAAPGQYQPVVEGDNGVINACQESCRFTVFHRTQSGAERTPTLTSLDRSTLVGIQKEIRQGETATFTANGTNFAEGATLVFLTSSQAQGLTVTDVDFFSPERLEITIAADKDAPTGEKDPSVRLTDGKTSERCDNCLVVTNATGPAPSPTGSASPQPGNDQFQFGRFAGTNRYDTAAKIATGSFTTAETVIIANGQSDDKRTARNESHFPDALAAAYLAGNRQAPTLLVAETSIPQQTRDALRSLQAKNVIIIGGTSAVSKSVEDELRRSYAVERIFGENRYETARAVAETPPVSYVGENRDGVKTAVVASGERFPDALVAGPLGYAAKFPVLITASAQLSDPTKRALTNLAIKHVLIPGGPVAVSEQTEAQIQALGITTERFAGQNRTETATLVAAHAYDQLNFDKAHVDLASGADFPDALSGGPHAGKEMSPILLTATKDQIGDATEAFLRQRGSTFEEGDIFGGLAAVSQQAQDQAETAIREGTVQPSPEPEPEPSESASPDPSESATASPDPSESATASPDPSGSATASPDPSESATASPAPSESPSPSP